MPLDSLAWKITTRCQRGFPGAGRISDAHSAYRQDATEISGMEMALMAGTGRKKVSGNSDFSGFLQRPSDSLRLHPAPTGSGKGWARASSTAWDTFASNKTVPEVRNCISRSQLVSDESVS